MKQEELVRALNQIHLEASITEALTYQICAEAREDNVKVLVNVLNAFNYPAEIDEVDRKWCLKKIKSLKADYKKLCLEIIKEPELIKEMPSIFVQAFSVMARCVYAMLSEREFLSFYRTVIKMIGAADAYISDRIFSDFMYLAESLQCCIEEIAELPRVQRMALGLHHSDPNSNKHLN